MDCINIDLKVLYIVCVCVCVYVCVGGGRGRGEWLELTERRMVGLFVIFLVMSFVINQVQ